MATQMNFRSAFNGFNREDVVHYIEFLNSKHVADLNQLNAELEYLHNRQPAQPAQPDDIVEQQAARIRELFDRCAALEQELTDAKAENAKLAEQVQQQNSGHNRLEEELEAYRRAERTERYARERADNLYHQANGALADATVKVDEAAFQFSQMTDKVVEQLSELQNAVASSKQALRDAAATLYTIRPSKENP